MTVMLTCERHSLDGDRVDAVREFTKVEGGAHRGVHDVQAVGDGHVERVLRLALPQQASRQD